MEQKSVIDEFTIDEVYLKTKLEEKDKIIDLMAERIVELKPCSFIKQKGGELLGEYRLWNKDEWKRYFEKKAQEEG